MDPMGLLPSLKQTNRESYQGEIFRGQIGRWRRSLACFLFGAQTLGLFTRAVAACFQGVWVNGPNPFFDSKKNADKFSWISLR